MMKAFPSKKMVDGPNDMLVVRDEEGMDLRDYFAAAALTGYIPVGHNMKFDVERAYEYADAMMAERAK